MKTQIVPISELHENPDNPRKISESGLDKLVKSIRDFPEMLRIMALRQAGVKQVDL